MEYDLSNLPNLFKIARNESLKSNYKQRIGCVITKGKRIVSRGHNGTRYKKIGIHKFTEWDNSLHAERDACSKLKKEYLNGCNIYLYREYCTGKPALSKPCNKCSELLKAMKIKYIYYTISTYPYYKKIKLKH